MKTRLTLLTLLLTASINLFSQETNPIELIVYHSDELQKIGIKNIHDLYKDLERIGLNRFVFSKKNVGKKLKYSGDSYYSKKYKESWIGHENRYSESEGTLLFEDGSFFVGKFYDRVPSKGLYVFDKNEYYVGELDCSGARNFSRQINFTKETILPRGTGSLFTLTSNGGKLISGKWDGKWNYVGSNYLEESLISGDELMNFRKDAAEIIPSLIQNITEETESAKAEAKRIISEAYSEAESIRSRARQNGIDDAKDKVEEEKKNKKALEDEIEELAVKAKNIIGEAEKEAKDLNGQAKKEKERLLNSIEDLKYDLKSLTTERSMAQKQIDYFKGELRIELVSKIKKLLADEKSLSDVLQKNKPDLPEYLRFMHNQDTNTWHNYRSKLEKHINTLEVDNFDLNAGMFKTIKLGALYNSSKGIYPLFKNEKFDTNVIECSLMNLKNNQFYKIYFFELDKDDFCIIQIQLQHA